MRQTATPLFAVVCFGAAISRVQVFPTHVTYQQVGGPDILVPSHLIASVEERVHQNEFVVLKTTTRRRIVCMVRVAGSDVRPKRAAALCAAIRKAHCRPQ